MLQSILKIKLAL